MKEYFLMLIYDLLCNISELFIVQKTTEWTRILFSLNVLCAFLNAKPAELFLMLMTVATFNWIPCLSLSVGFLREVHVNVKTNLIV